MKDFYQIGTQLTQAEITARQTAGTLPPAGVTIHVVDGSGNYVETKTSGGASTTPSSGGSGGSALAAWKASEPYLAGDRVYATASQGNVALGDVIQRNTAGTSGATFSATEAAKWTEIEDPDLMAHIGNTSNPHSVTKAQVGLGNVDNTNDVNKPVSTAQQTALDLKASLASPAFTGTPTGITKAHVGLGNIDNITDMARPISTATQTALDGKSATTHDHDTVYLTKSSLAVTPTVIHPENFAAATATGTAGTYTVSASSEFSVNYAGWKCFDSSDTTDWATLGVTSNFWVRMVLPAARVVTSIIVRGRNSGTERITSWVFQGSNNGTVWTTLLSSTMVLGNTAQTFIISNSTTYTQYRLFANTAETSNPGLSRLTLRADGFAFNNPVV